MPTKILKKSLRTLSPCKLYFYILLGHTELILVQPNIDSSNLDGSFTIAISNSFLSPYEFLPMAQNKYWKKFSYFIM